MSKSSFSFTSHGILLLSDGSFNQTENGLRHNLGTVRNQSQKIIKQHRVQVSLSSSFSS
jgi:hypothetical protein